MRYIYNLLFYCALPFILLRMLWRSFRHSPLYRKRWLERFAIFPAPKKPIDICIHAVSLGEAIAAISLIKAIWEKFPETNIAVTCTTITGSQKIQSALQNKVLHVYLPYDLPGTMRRFIQRLQPKIFVLMETELWPNLLKSCHDTNIPVIIANARLSKKSAKSYHRIHGFCKKMLQHIHHIAAQSAADAERFNQLGATKEKISVTGSIKFDISIDDEVIQEGERLRALCEAGDETKKRRPIWIAASTHPGEEEQVIEAHLQLLSHTKNALLILVPRHPERASEVLALCKKHALNFKLRSENPTDLSQQQVLIVDTTGELINFYACSDVAFVGGSLIPHGGHNILEPIALKKPTLSGPHVANFHTICIMLRTANGLRIVHNATELATTVSHLLVDQQASNTLVFQGTQVLEANRGAIDKQVMLLTQTL